MPTSFEQRDDYFNSIFHSEVVVGVNTSAMIEASIVGRPVLTILVPEHHDSQLGALHFSYLLESGGGALRAANSLAEHLDEIGKILAGRDREGTEVSRRFVAEFVRPRGLERPATPLLVDTLEQLAAASVAALRDPLSIIVLRRLIMLVSRLAKLPLDAKRLVRRGLRLARARLRRIVRARAYRRRSRAMVRVARARARRLRAIVRKTSRSARAHRLHPTHAVRATARSAQPRARGALGVVYRRLPGAERRRARNEARGV